MSNSDAWKALLAVFAFIMLVIWMIVSAVRCQMWAQANGGTRGILSKDLNYSCVCVMPDGSLKVKP